MVITGLLIIILVVVLLVVLSVRERTKLMMRRDKSWDAIGEYQASPLSRAITGLVGTAGGIYLASVLLVTFVEIDIPQLVQIGSVSLEPLAAISIALAIIQPFVLRLFELRRHF